MTLGRYPTEYWETNTLAEHVSLIRKQATKSVRDPETRKLAKAIVAGEATSAWGKPTQPNRAAACDSDGCVSQAIWDFTVQNIAYVPDPPEYDLFKTLKVTLLGGTLDADGRRFDALPGTGDCDDFVIAMAALHRALGWTNVKARVVSVGGKRWEHIYLLVGFPRTGAVSTWVPYDPTVKGAVPGWEYSKIREFADFDM